MVGGGDGSGILCFLEVSETLAVQTSVLAFFSSALI